MSVEHREDRGKWGYRFYLHGECGIVKAFLVAVVGVEPTTPRI
jgi:hypothetical protein